MENIKVLIVEDEKIVGMYIRDSLESEGYEVIGVLPSGERVIELITNFNPDIVLMDIILKGNIDGIETTELIQKRYNIPVIYITAHTDKSTINRAKMTEPYGYLVKPFNEKELIITIQMALHKHKMYRERYKNKFSSRKPTDKRKEQILDVSLQIISTDGIQKLTIKNITNEMQLTDSAIYKHFKSKSEIIDGLIEKVKNSYEKIHSKITNPDKSSEEKLKALILELGKQYLQNNPLINILFSEKTSKSNNELSNFLQEIKDKNQKLIYDIINTGQEKGEFSDEIEPNYLTSLIYGTVSNIITKWNNIEEFDLKTEIINLEKAIFKLIKS